MRKMSVHEIEPICESDFLEIQKIAREAVAASVSPEAGEAAMVMSVVDTSLLEWKEQHMADGYHAKISVNGEIAGFVVVKGYWCFSLLFVRPSHQGCGIGKLLVEDAIRNCRTKSPKNKFILNSSTSAQGFYRAMGFQQMRDGQDRPGGCIPFEYEFNNV